MICDYLRHFPFPRPPPPHRVPTTASVMTGSSFIPLGSGHDTSVASLEDTPILGPKWIKLPALTIGFIGLQALWSVEMSYGVPSRELDSRISYLLRPYQPHRISYHWGYQSPSWPSCSSRDRYPVLLFSPSLVQPTVSPPDHPCTQIVQHRSGY